MSRSIADGGLQIHDWKGTTRTFDPPRRLTYTRRVRRVLASLLGIALASFGGQMSALHTHVYTGHEHPDHDHGPAAHGHHSTQAASGDADTVRLEACDPGRHALSLVLGAAALRHHQQVAIESAASRVIEPSVLLQTRISLIDVRVHGPPLSRRTSPRAPPLIASTIA